MQPLSVLAYAAANAWEVISQSRKCRLYPNWCIMGHSYGAKWAIFASCLYESLPTAWSDPGIVFDETKDNYINYW